MFITEGNREFCKILGRYNFCLPCFQTNSTHARSLLSLSCEMFIYFLKMYLVNFQQFVMNCIKLVTLFEIINYRSFVINVSIIGFHYSCTVGWDDFPTWVICALVRIWHLSQWKNSEDSKGHCVHCKISGLRGGNLPLSPKKERKKYVCH